jgi:hypothetical protein
MKSWKKNHIKEKGGKYQWETYEKKSNKKVIKQKNKNITYKEGTENSPKKEQKNERGLVQTIPGS